MSQQNKEPTKVSRTTAGFFFRKECIKWGKVVYFNMKNLMVKGYVFIVFEGDYFGVWKIARSRCKRIMET